MKLDVEETELKKQFGSRLAQLRNTKKISAREMSLDIGQSEGYINSIETYKVFPSMSAFFYICEYLGVTPSEFFDLDNKNPKETDELLTAYRRLNLKQQELVLSLIKEIKPR
ncbi:MAG: helix-turn-helix domain-containing protein [Oscillospiraceae bacterium]|nr:helix-turn-helix domain-containing protein [Oscillospiraceae bacterium]